MKVWFNGAICDENEAVIPVTDHGFLYGMGLFETFRTYGGRPFLLREHLARLAEGCGELRILYRPDRDEIGLAIHRLLEANGLEDGYVRMSVSAGTAPLGLPAPEGYAHPNVSIVVKSLPMGMPQPKALHLLAHLRSTPEGAERRKSFHYMNNILAKWELSEKTKAHTAEGLFLNHRGFVTEGIVSNVFFVKQGMLYTPSIETGCLNGVTRMAVLELAASRALHTEEGNYGWDELVYADEVFVTNSVQEVTPVSMLADRESQTVRTWETVPGPVTGILQDAYKELVKGG